ncbi:MAG TPA: DNA cytosine methyltransferase [Polyangiaceae bacterium LLY-WYZ-14_1]|nr:DNA cytosine methyltransferase [Polyangiaceae bacterium LLY-WYZ-14_1]
MERQPYPELLAAAWRDATAPRADDAPTVVSTFAGCGGSSLGYAMAGYRELLAVENDGHAAETLRRNFPGLAVWEDDIAALTVEEARARAGIDDLSELDVLDGSPPCQGFSTAGRRRTDDVRNRLPAEFARLLGGLRPRAFVMENVAGMVRGKMAATFTDVTRLLVDQGYCVRVRLLNAKWYGVPQSRDRVIWVGVRDDLGVEPGHPAPLQAVPYLYDDAVAGLGFEAELGPEATPGTVGRRFVEACAPGEDLQDTAQRLMRIGPNEARYFSTVRLHRRRTPPTMLSSRGSWGLGMLHPDADRGISIAAAKRIASVPDGFELGEDFDAAWARLGNLVPPLLMRAVALKVRGLIGR